MSFRLIENIATADIAFKIWSPTIEGLFVDAADAMMSVMIRDLESIKDNFQFTFKQYDSSIETLLFNLLQELIFIKDSRRILCRLKDISLKQSGELTFLSSTLYGEHIDITRHELLVDVKAVTYHKFFVKNENDEWESQIILDI